MAGYTGIAAYASDFNRVRDDSLDSAFRAKARHRDDWLADYQMPEKMAETNANYLANAIEADTRSRGYDDFVSSGVDNAARGARESKVNLDKVVADQTLARLRGEASNRGAKTPEEIANYVNAHIDPVEVAANPYLSEAVLGQRRQAGQELLNLGTAIGGDLGDHMASRGLAGLGYGLQARRDDSGDLYWADGEGRRSAAYSEGARIPASQAFAGNLDPLARYYGAQEDRRRAAPEVQEFYSGDSVVQKIWNPRTGRYEDVAGYADGPRRASPYAAARTGREASVGFDANVTDVLRREGGFVPNDAGAGPTKYGINARANPGVDIANLTPDAAKAIYREKYWDAIGGDQLPPELQAAAFDAAVNQGPARARRWIAESGGDPRRFAELRQGHYDQLVRDNPQKYGSYAAGWARRNAETSGPNPYGPDVDAPAPLGVKYAQPKRSEMSEVGKRQQMIAELAASGAKLSPEDVQSILLTGKVERAGSGVPSEDERKAAGWLAQSERALANMENALAEDPDADQPGVLETYLPSEELANRSRSSARQRYANASSSAAEAILRAATGAGQNEQEVVQKITELTPQRGDSKEVRDQKLAGLKGYVDDLRVRAGRAAPAENTADSAGTPRMGAVIDGYRFKGGNPADPGSWEKV